MASLVRQEGFHEHCPKHQQAHLMMRPQSDTTYRSWKWTRQNTEPKILLIEQTKEVLCGLSVYTIHKAVLSLVETHTEGIQGLHQGRVKAQNRHDRYVHRRLQTCRMLLAIIDSCRAWSFLTSLTESKLQRYLFLTQPDILKRTCTRPWGPLSAGKMLRGYAKNSELFQRKSTNATSARGSMFKKHCSRIRHWPINQCGASFDHSGIDVKRAVSRWHSSRAVPQRRVR